MRVLLINNHCLDDPTAGVTQSLRTMVKWLAEAGHACAVVTTVRVETSGFDVASSLRARGVDAPAPRPARGGVPAVDYRMGDVPVSLLMTQHHDEARPDRDEWAGYVGVVERQLRQHAPDLLIACNAHPMIGESLARARRQGVTTTFTLRSYGYEDPRYFADVDAVFTCSRFLSQWYGRRIGLASTPIEPPLDWSTVRAPDGDRAFVTFVHPAPHKGLYLFARLADMLGSRRPDIPLLIVQSGHSAGALNGLAGLDFSRYPQILAAPPVATPAEYFALTRLLLVPSVWHEPFGRVAAEALINGIPALVSDRGALPDVIGGDVNDGGAGRVLRLPGWMTYQTTAVPTAAEVEAWYDAVCEAWDDAGRYRVMADRARRLADARYSEVRSRSLHLDYFSSLVSGERPAGTPPVAESASGLQT